MDCPKCSGLLYGSHVHLEAVIACSMCGLLHGVKWDSYDSLIKQLGMEEETYEC